MTILVTISKSLPDLETTLVEPLALISNYREGDKLELDVINLG
jgi:hypothetical protein